MITEDKEEDENKRAEDQDKGRQTSRWRRTNKYQITVHPQKSESWLTINDKISCIFFEGIKSPTTSVALPRQEFFETIDVHPSEVGDEMPWIQIHERIHRKNPYEFKLNLLTELECFAPWIFTVAIRSRESKIIFRRVAVPVGIVEGTWENATVACFCWWCWRETWKLCM